MQKPFFLFLFTALSVVVFAGCSCIPFALALITCFFNSGLYLIFDIKNHTMTFASKSFSVAHFKFEPKGSVNNPFNAAIGITSGSVQF